MSKEVVEEYVSSLAELTNNSKPHINMLTMLADDNIVHAPAIVDAVEKHLQKVPPDIKLPVLYLIDSIVKNVGQAYTELFSQNVVDMFCDVFAKVDEKTRAQMFKLRQTWNSVFPPKNLFILDTKVNKMDPAWPITAQPPIHVNPKFFNVSSSSSSTAATPPAVQASSAVLSAADAAIKEQLLKKQKKLLELQQEKLELELMQTRAKLEEQQKQLEKQTGHLKSADGLVALGKLIKKDGGKFAVRNTKSSKPSIVTSSQTVLTRSQLIKTQSKVEVKPTAEVKPTEAIKSSVTKIPEQTIGRTNILLKPNAAVDFKPPSKSETIEKFKSAAKSVGQKAEAKVKTQEVVLASSASEAEDALNIKKAKTRSKGKPRGLQEPWTVPTPTPVRIAPVSSQLISAARRARDPRIRKLENAENTPDTSVSGVNINSSHMAVGTKSSSTSLSDSSRDVAVMKTKTKTEMNIDHSKSGKNRKDRKSSSHRSREEKWQKKMAKIVKHYKTDKQVGYDKKQTVEETKHVGRSITNNDSKQSDVTEVKNPGKWSSDNSEKALSHKPSDSERTVNKNHEEAVVNTKLKLQRPAQSIPEKSSLKGQESESTAPVKGDRSEKFSSRQSDMKSVYYKHSDNSDKTIKTLVNKYDVSQTQTSSDASAANKNFSDSDKYSKSMDSIRALNNKANDKSYLDKQSESLQKCSVDFEKNLYVPENVNVLSSKHIEQISSPKCEFADEHTKVPIVDDKTSKILVSEDGYNNSKTDHDERTLLLADSKMTYTKLKSNLSDDLLRKSLSNEELDRRMSPQSSEKRLRRNDQKMTIMEKMLANTEVDEASPSPPPPPVISDKFKEVKPSSLSRLRKYGRNRDGSESPPGISTTNTTTTTVDTTGPVVATSTTTATTVADVDLRQPPVSLIGDQKNDVVAITASADKDVDLRQLPSSPKKRSSADRSEPPPSKKSKAEMFDDINQDSSWEGNFENDQVQNYCHSKTRLFGSEDVDLRPQLSAAPLPSPPPPPVISHSPPPPSDKEDKENVSERLWAKYKQQKPESFKSSYRQNNQFKSSPAFRRGQGPFAQYDRRRLLSQEDEDTWHSGRQWYGEDTDMRASFILNEVNKQLKTGNITELQYQKVLSEMVTMNEKQKLAEAQFKDEEEERLLYERNEELEPISEDDGSFTGSLSPTQNDEVISSISDPNTSSMPDRDSESSNVDQANLEPYDPGDSVVKHDSADVDHRMYTKEEHNLHSSMLEVPTSCSESNIDNRIPMDVSHPDSTKEAGEVTYKRYPNQREDQRGQRQERKQRRRKEDRDHRDKPYRKTRFNQIGPGNWVPFDGRHKNIDSQMDAEYLDSRIPHKDFIHNQVISSDMSIRNKGSTDNRNFQDSTDMPSYPVNMHSSRYGNDSNIMETGHKDYPPMHSVAPWDRSRQPPPIWMRGTAPPLLRYPPPLLLKPPGYTANRWRIPPPGTAPMRPMFDSDIRFNRFLPPNITGRFPLPGEIPPSDPVILDMITADPTVPICIDSKHRDIRFYGDTAVALMDWDDPREISFVSGQRRKIIIDDRESFILTFNTPYKEVLIDGQPHRIKLGAPTRELYIDGKFYEVRFGGPPVNIDIGGKIRSVQLDGPTPTVMRSGIKRSDLVLGKIKLIVDAQIYFPVFLDAKPQRFDIEGIPYILQFVDALQTVLINGVPFKAEFGGLPKPIVLNGKKHFFRLTSLPRGITPGHVTIVNMEGGRLPTPPPPILPPPPQIPLALQLHDMDLEPDNNSRSSDPALHLTSEPNLVGPSLSPVEGQAPADISNINSEVVLNPQVENIPVQQPVPVSVPDAPPAPSNPVDVLASLMPTNPPPQVNYNYSVENDASVTASAEPASQQTQMQSQAPSGMIPFLTGEINVSELLQKLVASGIVPGSLESQKMPSKEKPVEPESDAIKPVDFLKTETLKTRQPGLIATLYSGIQCSSCGVRFAPEQTMKYSQHLDWHFRQNRRDKDSARTAQSRKWYYDVSDWIQFEEIEDLEERAQSWFESQVGQSSINAEAEEPAKEIPSVAAGEFGEDAACEICRDKFEQFYNEEREEWHLRQAIKVDNKLYHPICHQDYRASLDAPIEISLDESTTKEEVEPSTFVDDDNDDVIECEIIKPEVPFEDLTVSDCESVHDEKEEKLKLEESMEAEISNSESTVNDTETKDEGLESTKSEDVVDVKDDASQDVSAVDFEMVVKNIKKEPVDDGDVDGSETSAKNGKGDVPLPEPVVDTTHVEVSCSIDGNLQFEEKHQLAVSAPPKIKINITKALTVHLPRDSKESESDVADDAETPSTSSGTSIVVPPPQTLLDQPPPPGEEPTPIILPRKPRLVGKKLQELPPVSKGTELSGLCSIM